MTDFSQLIEKMLEPYKQIHKAAKPFRKFDDVHPFQGVKSSFDNIAKFGNTLANFETPFQKQLEQLKDFGNALKELDERIPKDLLIIAHHGWFVDFDSEISLPSRVVNAINDNNLERANNLIEQHYLEQLDYIFRTLKERHSNREMIFNELKSLFETKKYYAFIPTIFSQVDGICFDFTKKKFFIKEQKNNWLPQVTAELEKEAESFTSLYLSPMQNQTPVMARENDLHKFPCKFNRHEIMHGVSLDYGTKVNALKSLSLIKYTSDLLNDKY